MPSLKKNPGTLTSLTGLLVLLGPGLGFCSKKTGSVLFHAEDLYVKEYFDDGKGHSGAFTSERSPVDPKLFEIAVSNQYLHGKLEPGYVSTREFVITEKGKSELYERFSILAKVLHRLNQEEKPLATICEGTELLREPTMELLEDILDFLVWEGRAVSSLKEGRKFYRASRQEDFV